MLTQYKFTASYAHEMKYLLYTEATCCIAFNYEHPHVVFYLTIVTLIPTGTIGCILPDYSLHKIISNVLLLK